MRKIAVALLLASFAAVVSAASPQYSPISIAPTAVYETGHSPDLWRPIAQNGVNDNCLKMCTDTRASCLSHAQSSYDQVKCYGNYNKCVENCIQ